MSRKSNTPTPHAQPKQEETESADNSKLESVLDSLELDIKNLEDSIQKSWEKLGINRVNDENIDDGAVKQSEGDNTSQQEIEESTGDSKLESVLDSLESDIGFFEDLIRESQKELEKTQEPPTNTSMFWSSAAQQKPITTSLPYSFSSLSLTQ